MAFQDAVAAVMAPPVWQIFAAMPPPCALGWPWRSARLSRLQPPAVRRSSCSMRILVGWRLSMQWRDAVDGRWDFPGRCSLVQVREFVGHPRAVNEPVPYRGPVNPVGDPGGGPDSIVTSAPIGGNLSVGRRLLPTWTLAWLRSPTLALSLSPTKAFRRAF